MAGNSHDAVGYKLFRGGTHRTADPAETLARVRPFMRAMGITRVANITGLDVIGIPVVMVCRPNSRSLAVFQGKGLDLAAAKASGVMEAVETYHAERITRPLKLGCHEELAHDHPMVNITALPQSTASRYHERLPILWIAGQNLFEQAPVWVPYELVHTNYTRPSLPGDGCFPANTNGLASGNHLLEAISHGICEVIERDATTLWKLKSLEARSKTGLNPASIDDARCCEVLAKFEQADVDVKIWEITSDVGVASFLCLVQGRQDEYTDPEFGAGCHPARSVALLRALTEAAQARTTFIAGARDDFLPEAYTSTARAQRLKESHRLMAAHSPQRDFHQAPDWQAESHKEDVDWLLQRLRAVNIEQVVAIDLTQEAFQLPVSRVIIPGLEGPYEGTDSEYMPGPRALAILQGRT